MVGCSPQITNNSTAVILLIHLASFCACVLVFHDLKLLFGGAFIFLVGIYEFLATFRSSF